MKEDQANTHSFSCHFKLTIFQILRLPSKESSSNYLLNHSSFLFQDWRSGWRWVTLAFSAQRCCCLWACQRVCLPLPGACPWSGEYLEAGLPRSLLVPWWMPATKHLPNSSSLSRLLGKQGSELTSKPPFEIGTYSPCHVRQAVCHPFFWKQAAGSSPAESLWNISNEVCECER